MENKNILKLLTCCADKQPEKEGFYLTYNERTECYTIAQCVYSNFFGKWIWHLPEIPTHWLKIR